MDLVCEITPMTLGTTAADMLLSALRSSTPMAFAICSEIMAERAGIVNIGIEGQMLVGAAAGFGVTVVSGNPWVGLLAGAVAGAALSSLHGILCLVCRANQTVSGIAVMAIGVGCSSYFGTPYVGRRISGFAPMSFPRLPAGLAGFLGSISPTMVLGIATPLVMCAFLYMTRWGLRWRAVGESPTAARVLGINPALYKWAAILVCGLLVGVGGAALSVDYAKGWSDGMTSGRGLVALGLVALTRWNPLLTTPVAMIFGAAESLSLSVQSHGIGVSPYLLSLFPYLTPLVVLALHAKFAKRRSQMPASLANVQTFGE
jgi:general nucleoside transport system permease protein